MLLKHIINWFSGPSAANKIEAIKKETYSVTVFCYNCDYESRISLPKGTRFKKRSICPNCGLPELRSSSI